MTRLDDLYLERFGARPTRDADGARHSRSHSARWNRVNKTAQAMAAAVGATWDELPDALRTELHTVADDLIARMERPHG